MNLPRRDVLMGLAAGGALLSGCRATPAGDCAEATAGKAIEWRMYTTWPKNFPGLGTGANRLAETITRMSGGRLKVTVFGAGERVPALEVFDAVSRGSAQMGHGGAYYWKGKAPAAPFFAAVPFGFTAQEMSAWLYYGGGLELWRELYAPFNLIPFDAGNTGTQMGGWFRKPIESVADLRGLKMRIPGMGGEVMARLGVTAVNIPGGELFTALSTGTIDATEWVGPYNDLAFGLHRAAPYYYYPGWHEPGTCLEALVNLDAWKALPPDLQAIVSTACAATSHTLLAEMTARNQTALKTLVEEHGVQLRPFPPEVLAALRQVAETLIDEAADADPFTARVVASYRDFRDQVFETTRISEQAYLEARRG
jgi:TRAP-type mannitol/chloroaromatic compound transport system substrate-binding protein